MNSYNSHPSSVRQEHHYAHFTDGAMRHQKTHVHIAKKLWGLDLSPSISWIQNMATATKIYYAALFFFNRQGFWSGSIACSLNPSCPASSNLNVLTLPHPGSVFVWSTCVQFCKKSSHPHNSVQMSLPPGSSVFESCLTLCDPMDCSTPDFPVHHQLLEFTQTHVHWVSDAIQPSHPLSSRGPSVNASFSGFPKSPELWSHSSSQCLVCLSASEDACVVMAELWSRLPKTESWLCHLLPAWPWEVDLNLSACFSLLTYKMGMIMWGLKDYTTVKNLEHCLLHSKGFISIPL